jgi:hypothetical protein
MKATSVRVRPLFVIFASAACTADEPAIPDGTYPPGKADTSGSRVGGARTSFSSEAFPRP